MIRKVLLLITIISLLLPIKALPSDYGKYLPRWIELLKQGNDRERKLALHSLWFLEYPEFRKDISVFDPILNVLKDKDPSLREAAASSLGRIGELSEGCCKETKIVPSLIEALGDSDSKVRQESANALGYYKDKRAIGPLIKKINDKDPWVRLNVVFSLGELNAKEAIAPLIDLLDDDTDWRDKFVQQECLIALRKMGGYIVIGDQRRLISVLMRRFDDEYLKAEIIKTLGFFHAEEAINLIIIATKDSNERIRKIAIDALSRFTRGGPQTNKIDIYTNALKDPSVVVRVEAVEALRRLSWSSRNREIIVDLLIGALSDSSKDVRIKAIEALSSFTDIRILDALINHFSEYQGYYKNPAAESFLSISEKTCRERVYTYRKDGIRYVSRSDKEIPKEAGYYFEHIVHPAAVDRLISALNNTDPNTKLVALEIIWKFEDSRVEEHLIKLLDDPFPLVRQRAISALFSIGRDKSVPKLIEALKDSDIGVRTEAARVLKEFKIEATIN